MPDREEARRGNTYILSGDYRGSIVNIESETGGEQRIVAEQRPRVFLSYAWADDQPFAARLQRDLQEAGFDVWRDQTDLPSRGPDLSDELRAAIDERPRFVPIIGPAAFTSAAVQAE